MPDLERDKMNNAYVCTTCAGKLKFNVLIGFYECTACGKIYAVTDDQKPLSLSAVNQLVLTRKYDEAQEKIRYLLETDPDNTMLHLSSLLSRKRAVNTTQLLVAASNSEEQLKEVRDDQEWETIRTVNDGNGKKIADLVKEYCDDQITMADLRRKYGPEIGSKKPVDVPAPNEVVIKRVPRFLVCLISFLFWSAIVIPTGLLIAKNSGAFIEDWSVTKGYYQRLGNEDIFSTYVALIIVALTALTTFLVPMIRTRMLRKKGEKGMIRFLKDGTPVKATPQIQDHSSKLRPDEAAVRKYLKLETRCSEISEEIRLEEARLLTES